MFGTIGRFLDSQILPHLMAFRAEWKLTKQRKQISEATFTLDNDTKIDKRLVESLKQDHRDELERWNRVTEKARSGLFIVGVTIVIMLTSLRFFADHREVTNAFGVTLLVLTVVSFVLSAVTLTMAINIRERYSIFLDDLVQVQDERLTPAKMADADWVRKLYHAGRCNQKTATIISNYVAVSYIGIRNGIILLAVFFVVSLFSI